MKFRDFFKFLESKPNFTGLKEARSTKRNDDVRSAGVWTYNFPTRENPNGEQRSFYSSLEAAQILIAQGRTESDNEMSVARNIFASAMCCEGRTDRTTDHRKSAYKTDATIDTNTILWDFVDIDELSPENREIYLELHNGKFSPPDLEDPEDIQRCKNILSNEKYFKAFMNVVKNKIGFWGRSWFGRDVKVKFNSKGFVTIPTPIHEVISTLKWQIAHIDPNDPERKMAEKYARAIKILQNKGYLPKDPTN